MPRSALPLPHDPLGDYGLPAVISGTRTPVPLVGTSFAVKIDAGLALVTTTRRFRNAETQSIEVTMTFPVPVHATLFDLVARIGERSLRARAQSRTQARDTYEDSIDQGRTAVLHEEVLRGVHQLSIAHVPPGADIEVEASWAMPLAAVPGGGVLHIPVTVGDVYGRSPVPDSDELFHGAEVHEADLTVDCRDGIVTLAGSALSQGCAKLRLNALIRLTVTGWQPRTLRGIAADGRGVQIEINAAPSGCFPLDAAILVDRSGSMNEAATAMLPTRLSTGRARTKHEVLVAGLMEAAAAVGPMDQLDLWEFNNAVEQVPGNGLADAVSRLSPPSGGTETGEAIRAVLAGRPTRDVLLVTDGKSYALDVQAAARSGRRFHVVLIGEDSLEARVGHLAALSGGQIFIAAGLESGSMIQKAIEAMRLPHTAAPAIQDTPKSVETILGGMQLRAVWSDQAAADTAPWSRAVAAVAAALALPRMSEERAAAFAAAEGIVCHLTSLVLVDENGEAQDGLPAQRRVGLTTPETTVTLARSMDVPPEAASSMSRPLSVAEEPSFRLRPSHEEGPRFPVRPSKRPLSLAVRGRRSTDVEPEVLSMRPASELTASPRSAMPDRSLRGQLGRVDWATDPEALRRGDLSMLPAEVAEAVRLAADRPEVLSLAASLDTHPIVVVLALLADAESGVNRSAERFARIVLRKTAASFFARIVLRKRLDGAVAAAARAIGL
nr:VIT domain-containing protein [Roseomonas rosulenta]